MSRNSFDADKVVELEFHDAVLRSVTLIPPDGTEFRLDYTTIYCASARPEIFEVWTAESRLSCTGVSGLKLRGSLIPDLWVSDAFFRDERGGDVQLIPLGEVHRVRTARLIIGPAEFIVSLANAKLDIVRIEGREEDWVGPLKDQ